MFSEPDPFGHALDVEAVPVGDEVPVHDRQPVADVRAGVLAREHVHRVRAQRVLDRRARRARLQGRVDARRVEREVLADATGVDGDAGVLADEVLLLVGDRDVAMDRLEDPDPGLRGLAVTCGRERVAEVLRDVLQRPDVEVRGGILDGRRSRSVVGDRAHALAFSAGCPACAPSEDDALEQRVAHHAVAPVGAACDLTAGVEALERGLGALVDHEAAVLVVEDGIGEERLRQRVDARRRGSAAACTAARRRRRPPGSGSCRGRPPGGRPRSRRRGPPRPRRRSPARRRRADRASR